MSKNEITSKESVKENLNSRHNTKHNIGFSLSKEMSDQEIESAMLDKLSSVRKELGLQK
ncbi:TPA: hypothetical protein ACPVZG_000463 [Vibrio parahaemolyticus]|nr:hypothetical protein [Vibrio vulnificus]